MPRAGKLEDPLKRWRPTKLPPEWAAYGARWGRDGLLYLDEWRRGFDVHELRALFFRVQQTTSLEIELRQARAEIEALQNQIDRLQCQRAFYRQQCRAEARSGFLFFRDEL